MHGLQRDDMKNTPTYRISQPWLVCMSAALFFFFEFMQMQIFSTIGGELMRDLHVDAIGLSTLASAFLIANTLFLIPAGLILDRVSTRQVIIALMSICILGTAIFSLTDQYYIAMTGRFLAGTGNAFCFLSCLILVTRWFPQNQRAFASAIIVTFAMLGGITAQTPFRLCADLIGWRYAMLLDCAFGVLFLMIIIRFVKDSPDKLENSVQQMPFLTSLIHSVRNYRNLFYGIYTALMNLPIILLGAMWGSLYLNQVHHLNMTYASLSTSMIFFGMIVGSPLFGAWSDYLQRRHLPMLLGAVASIVCIIMIMMSPELHKPQALFWFFALGLFSSTQILAYPTISEINPDAYRGTALGVASTIIMGIASASQPFFGYLMQRHWDHTTFHNIPLYTPENYNYAMLMLPIAFVIAFLSVCFMKENNKILRG